MTLPQGQILKTKVKEEPKVEVCTEVHFLPSVTLHQLEKQYIIKALAYYGNNKSKTAISLGITIKTLFNKLHEYGLFEEYRLHTKDAEA